MILTLQKVLIRRYVFSISRALSKDRESWNQTRNCIRARRTGGFMKRQVKVCKDNLELMDVIAGSTQQAAQACQKFFSDRRWNCSSITKSPDFLADLTGGTCLLLAVSFHLIDVYSYRVEIV